MSRPWWRRAGAALLPATAAVGVQWFAHTGYPRLPFAPYSVGDWIVRRVPGGVATAAIDALGHDAQRLLAAGTIAGALALGVALRHRSPVVLAGTAVAATLAAAALDPRQPSATAAAAAAVLAGSAAGGTQALLHRPAIATARHGPRPGPDHGRRRLLAVAALAAPVLLTVPAALRRWLTPTRPEVVRADHSARVATDPAFEGLASLSPLVSSRDDHYTVDIDLDDPALDSATWRLRITGAVDHTQAFRLDELRAMPTVERLATLSCISNPVGGRLVGNARWTGVPVADLLHRAGLHRGARTVAVHAADGYHETIPLDLAGSDDDVLIAFAMDGLVLPRAHGFPARLLVPARYGMKNVKWVTELVVTDDDPGGYWGERGWDPSGLVQTESRIDVPAANATVRSPFVVAGIAWAGDRSISAVEVSADDGATWQPARLERASDPLSWRRWRLTLDLPPGAHPLTVRATDSDGTVQTADRRQPHPAGATGRHRITINVAG